MTYRSSNLSVLAYANNFTLWHYTTEDKLKDVAEPGYFNSAVSMLRVNDVIITNVDTDDTNITQFFVVRENTGHQIGLAPYASVPLLTAPEQPSQAA